LPPLPGGFDTTRACPGYFDGWVPDGLFYTGEGQRGDQALVQGNLAVLRHREEWRSRGSIF